jgi:glycosyltransferase involved in cell wall biosynthesis
MEKMNELYNCLDLYLVSSRCEGGPRSVFEAGLTKTPIISTRVGISPELMDSAALFDCDNWMTYKDAIPATNILHQNVIELTSDKYMEEFKDALFS